MTRYARKVDTTQSAIVETLRLAGWMVWVIEEPCDLLCYQPSTGRWQPLECKSPRNKNGDPRLDKRQVKQNEFIKLTGTPRVTSSKEALQAIGYYSETA
jgi:hypothetical protein